MSKQVIIALVLSTMVLVGGTETISGAVGAQQPAAIDVRLDDVRAQIARAELEGERATDDLVKTLIAVRLAILRNTEAMLEQKKIAVEQGITLTYAVEGALYQPGPPGAELIAGLTAAIADTEAQVDVAIARAAAHADPAARSTAAEGVATLENTLAMLRQRWYAATYSIPYIGKEAAEPEAASPSAPTVAARPPIGGGVEMVEINLRVTDATTTWWEMSWWLTLRNANDEDVRVTASIQFLDEDGEVVDEYVVSDLQVPAAQEEVFRGARRVDVLVAPQVRSIFAKIQYTRD